MKKILRPGKNCIDIIRTDESGLIIDARDYYRAFFEAARQARHFILLAGWQFDTQVKLLHGSDETMQKRQVQLLPFLMELCGDNKDLHVLILSWDFSTLYALEREWFQDILFSKWGQNERIHFRFDSSHAMGASHHRKVAVIDGAVAFLGGMDLCEARWDDRKHSSENPYRVGPTGNPYPPVHDIQGFVNGEAALKLSALFCEWWFESGGGLPVLPDFNGEYTIQVPLPLRLSGNHVAISRTETRSIMPSKEPVTEIRELYKDAIDAAENLIYIENQYFSSRAIYDALVKRLNEPGRSRLNIIIILPKEAHALFEKISIIRSQAWILESLLDLASRRGHFFAAYSTIPGESRLESEQTYIHSKLVIVDDRFIMVGSANMNNRGMGLDTEINLSWEADNTRDEGLIKSIRNIRANLLAEHIGAGRRLKKRLERADGMVLLLNEIARKKKFRLRFNIVRNGQSAAERIGRIEDAWPFDSERPPVEEGIYEVMSQEPDGLLASSLTILNGLITSPARNGKPVLNDAGGMVPAIFVPKASIFRAITVRRLIYAIILLATITVILYLVL